MSQSMPPIPGSFSVKDDDDQIVVDMSQTTDRPPPLDPNDPFYPGDEEGGMEFWESLEVDVSGS